MLLHGFSACADTWRPILPALQRRHEVIALTFHGHMGGLVKDFKINTVNLKEGTAKVQEMVTQVMMNAVYNSQIIAGN